MGFASKLPAIVLAALALGFAPVVREKPPLRYKYKTGEKIEYVLRLEQKMSMTVNGTDIEMKVGIGMEMTWQTLSIDQKGNARVKVTFPRVKMSIHSPAADVEVDSREDAEPNNGTARLLVPAVKALAALETTFTATPQGEIKDAKLGEEALQKVKSIPGGNVADMFSSGSFRSMVSGNMVLPKGTLQKGQSWTQKTRTKLPFGTMTGTTRFTFDGTVEKSGAKLARILVVPDMKLESDASATAVHLRLKHSKGQVLFDAAAGRVAETTTETTMEMEVNANGMAIQQLVKQTMTMRLKGPKSPSPGRTK